MNFDKHFWMMILCCVIPVVLLALVYVLDVSNKYFFWLVVALCPLTHIIMMKYLHK